MAFIFPLNKKQKKPSSHIKKFSIFFPHRNSRKKAKKIKFFLKYQKYDKPYAVKSSKQKMCNLTIYY